MFIYIFFILVIKSITRINEYYEDDKLIKRFKLNESVKDLKDDKDTKDSKNDKYATDANNAIMTDLKKM